MSYGNQYSQSRFKLIYGSLFTIGMMINLRQYRLGEFICSPENMNQYEYTWLHTFVRPGVKAEHQVYFDTTVYKMEVVASIRTKSVIHLPETGQAGALRTAQDLFGLGCAFYPKSSKTPRTTVFVHIWKQPTKVKEEEFDVREPSMTRDLLEDKTFVGFSDEELPYDREESLSSSQKLSPSPRIKTEPMSPFVIRTTNFYHPGPGNAGTKRSRQSISASPILAKKTRSDVVIDNDFNDFNDDSDNDLNNDSDNNSDDDSELQDLSDIFNKARTGSTSLDIRVSELTTDEMSLRTRLGQRQPSDALSSLGDRPRLEQSQRSDILSLGDRTRSKQRQPSDALTSLGDRTRSEQKRPSDALSLGDRTRSEQRQPSDALSSLGDRPKLEQRQRSDMLSLSDQTRSEQKRPSDALSLGNRTRSEQKRPSDALSLGDRTKSEQKQPSDALSSLGDRTKPKPVLVSDAQSFLTKRTKLEPQLSQKITESNKDDPSSRTTVGPTRRSTRANKGQNTRRQD
ncbi:hypothetical protein F4861DRAFT_541116 [Xylaria intraflava]|nr:hypothetical protein F4861DRAFT_541116 [Xylaria intraflava]